MSPASNSDARKRKAEQEAASMPLDWTLGTLILTEAGAKLADTDREQFGFFRLRHNTVEGGHLGYYSLQFVEGFQPLDLASVREAAKAEERGDLAERLGRAVARLEERIPEVGSGHREEKARLGGKVEGVKLALSYLHEAARIARGGAQ